MVHREGLDLKTLNPNTNPNPFIFLDPKSNLDSLGLKKFNIDPENRGRS